VISPIQNSDVADSFEEVADLLEIEHENRFRVKAYRVACGGAEDGLGGNVTVELEVGTAEGNRIDILIRSDSHAVLIENKTAAEEQ